MSSLSPDPEKYIRQMAVSSSIRFGTEAPFQLGNFLVAKIGFANIPVVGMVVTCRPEDRGALTPIVRSFVYTELEGAGIPNEAVEFTPTIGQTERGSRATMFVDTNESSPTKGKRKKGQVYEWHFEIKKPYVDRFVWPKYGSPSRGKLPEFNSGQEESQT